MRILLDMDEVIEELVPTLINKYNQIHGTHHKISEIQHWEVPKWDPELWTVIEDTDVILELPPKGNSIYYIEKWIEEGHEVYIVTNTIDTRSQELKQRWIKKHIPYFDLNKMIFIKDKHIIKGDIFVDDCIRNILKWEKENPEGCAFLMRAQHNLDKDYDGKLITSLKYVDDYIYNR